MEERIRTNKVEELRKKGKEVATTLETKATEVSEKMGSLQKQKEVLEGELAPKKSQREEYRRKREALQTEINNIEENNKKRAESAAVLKSKIAELAVEEKKKRSELDSVENRLKQLQNDIQQAKADETLLANEEKQLFTRIQERSVKVQSIKTAIADAQARNTLLHGLLQAQDRGELSGIIGRLGNLGTIEERYDAAITNACPLDNIVVRSQEHATAAVQYMKERKLGRAHIIVLDIVNKRFANVQDPPLPHGVPCQLLVNLVRPKQPEYRAAFYHVLSSTLVVTLFFPSSDLGRNKAAQCFS